jgi:hypothetical protein
MVLEGHGVGWLPETLVRWPYAPTECSSATWVKKNSEHELQSGRLVRAGDPEWDIDFQVRIFRPITVALGMWT